MYREIARRVLFIEQLWKVIEEVAALRGIEGPLMASHVIAANNLCWEHGLLVPGHGGSHDQTTCPVTEAVLELAKMNKVDSLTMKDQLMLHGWAESAWEYYQKEGEAYREKLRQASKG